MFGHIHIIGLGLIGSSIARAIKTNNLAEKLTGFSRKEGIEGALKLGIIDVAMSSKDLKKPDIVIIAAPLSAYAAVGESISHLKNVVITDAGSVKCEVINIMRESLGDNFKNFVPAHPIAGSEKTGVYSGTDDLFKGKKLIIAPAEETNQKAISKVKELWEALGSNVEILEAARHDAIYAKVSHLPQALAFIYIRTVEEGHVEYTAEYKKFIRLTNSDANMWAEIFLLNNANLIASIKAFKKELQKNLKEAEEAEEENYFSHQVAPLIAQSLKNITKAVELKYAGSGFKDFTAIAAKTTKSKETEKFLLQFIKKLDSFAKAIS